MLTTTLAISAFAGYYACWFDCYWSCTYWIVVNKKWVAKYSLNSASYQVCFPFTLFPETCAIAHAYIGTHASKFTCAIYYTHKIIVFSRKEKFFIEEFSTEHRNTSEKILRSLVSSNKPLLTIF